MMALIETNYTWLVLVFLAAHYCVCVNGGESQVPCLFIFGDSLSDCGNNNNLPTSAKSDYKPYGIDFPIGPTGRFTNGRTQVDIITQLLGFENFIPPFANTSGSDILKGVNYASGAAGIRAESGVNLGACISMGSQIKNHIVIVSEIASRLGSADKAQEYLEKCLYYVNIGSNDYINNYFLPQYYPTSSIYNPEQYAEVLVEELSKYLLNLHEVGARNYVLVGLGLLGCTPNAIYNYGINGSCAVEENAASVLFDNKLKSQVEILNNNSADSKFIFINSTAVAVQPGEGFTVSTVGCCPSSSLGECIPDGIPCYNRSTYVFWDNFHPTEAWNKLNADTAYDSSSNPDSTYPYDIKQLVDLEIEMELKLSDEFTSQKFSAAT